MVTAPTVETASSAPKKGSEGPSSSSSSSSDKAGGAAVDDANDNNNVDDEEMETDPATGDANTTTGPAATQHASKKSKTGPSGESTTTATADSEGDQVAEAEMEEEEDGAVVGSGGTRQEDAGLTSQSFSVGGVVPEVGLTSRPKGRFASQVSDGQAGAGRLVVVVVVLLLTVSC